MPGKDGTGPDGTGPIGGKNSRGGNGRGRMGGPYSAGPGGNCVCPKCGNRIPHVVGEPCSSRDCQKCGSKMTRE